MSIDKNIQAILNGIDPLNLNVDAVISELKLTALMPGEDSGINYEAILRKALSDLAFTKHMKNKADKQLGLVQDYVDSQVSSLMDLAVSSIADYKSAAVAYLTYTAGWFALNPASIPQKQSFAQGLALACAQFKITSDFWDNLVKWEPAAVDFAEFRGTKNA